MGLSDHADNDGLGSMSALLTLLPNPSPDLRWISAGVAKDETGSWEGEAPRNRTSREPGDESSAFPFELVLYVLTHTKTDVSGIELWLHLGVHSSTA